jgi:CheY-like chemotaxis protein
MPKIAAIVSDLGLMTKIRNTAESFALTVGFVGSKDQLNYYLKDCDLVIIDLENDIADSVDLIRRIRADRSTTGVRTIGYLSNTNAPLRDQVLAAGCNEVLSRVEISSNLRDILRTACY